MSIVKKDKLDKKLLKKFFYMINERHRIYLNRKKGKSWPWTKDKILQDYRFCNVFRELDTVTIWIRKNWREPYADHPNLWFAMAMARQINWPETLEEIGFPEKWKPNKIKRIMQERKERKEKIYTGAYMLTGTLGGTKVEQTIDKILTPLYNDPIKIKKGDSLQSVWKQFLPRPGFSGFMSYEVVTDLRHTRYLKNSPDIMTWANAGPGAVRGLNRLYNIKVASKEERKNKTARTVKMSGEWYLQKMRVLLKLSKKYLDSHVPQLEMREIEHSLCEFDKYQRTKLGQGRPRSKYKNPEN